MYKIKLADVELLYHKLDSIKKAGARFAYWRARMMSALEGEVTAMQDAAVPPPRFQKYEEERRVLALSYVDRDAAGNPLARQAEAGGSVTFAISDAARQEEYQSKMAELEAEYQKAIAERAKQLEECAELKTQAVSLELPTANLADLPDPIDTELVAVLVNNDLLEE